VCCRGWRQEKWQAAQQQQTTQRRRRWWLAEERIICEMAIKVRNPME
jgi:hypothetical protein